MKTSLARAVCNRAITNLQKNRPDVAADMLRSLAEIIHPGSTPCPARLDRSSKKTSAKRSATCGLAESAGYQPAVRGRARASA